MRMQKQDRDSRNNLPERCRQFLRLVLRRCTGERARDSCKVDCRVPAQRLLGQSEAHACSRSRFLFYSLTVTPEQFSRLNAILAGRTLLSGLIDYSSESMTSSFDENPYSRDFFSPDFNPILCLATRSSKYYSIAEEFLKFSQFA